MEPLEVVILGSGSGVPTPRRNHSSVWVRREGDVFLWDCGEGTQLQLQKAGLSFMKIDRIFITHWHADHFAGLLGLIESFNLEGRERKLEIYGPEASRFVSILLDLSWYDFGFEIDAVDVEFEEDEENIVYENDEFVVKSTPTEHSVPSVAYCLEEKGRWNIDTEKASERDLYPGPEMKVLKEEGSIEHGGEEIKLEDVAHWTEGRKIVYSGDTKPTETVERLADKATLLIHDSTFKEDSEKEHNHSSAVDAAKLASRADAEKLVLTHFSRRLSDLESIEETAGEYHGNVVAAKDLMRIEL